MGKAKAIWGLVALGLMGAAVVALAVPPAAGQSTRFPGARQPFGKTVGDVALVDVDSDGWLDLLAAAGGLGVRLGAGHGTFGPLVNYAVAGSSSSLLVDDLDGDGDEDAVVTAFGGGTVPDSTVVFRGSPNGSFAVQATYPSGADVLDAAAGDLNADGFKDLVVLFSGSSTGFLNVRLGGHSGFGTSVKIDLPAYGSRLAMADLDLDGALDVAVSTRPLDGIFVLGGNGDGTLQAPQVLAAVSEAEPLCVADVDADGTPDLIAASNSLQGTIAVLLNHGDGTFEPAAEYDSGFVYCSGLEAADIDRDGALDLLVATNSRLALLPGLGDGTFGAPIQHVSGAITQLGIAVGDIDRDGTPDVAVSDWEGMDVTVLDGDSDGGLATAALQPGPSTFARGVAVGDFDGDGDLDVFATNEWDDTGLTWLNDGNGEFALTASVGVGDAPWWAQAGLLDGDAVPDLLTIDRTTATVQTFLGQGDGSFVFHQAVATGGQQPREGALGDLDHDGDLDAVVVNELSSTVTVLLGDGAGGFAPPAQTWPIHGSLARNLALGDVTGDGELDVIAAPFSDSFDYTLLPGLGDGGFGPAHYFEPGNDASDLALTDLDGDGRLDVIICHYFGKLLSVSLNTGDEENPFQNFGVSYPTYPVDGGGPVCMQVADFDGDGALDVAVGASGTFRVELSFGDGRGGLELRESYAVDETGTLIRAADWDGNGRPDLLAVAQNLSVLLERTQQPWVSVGAGLAGSGGIPHLDGDGTLVGGQPLQLALTHARPSSPATLIVGLDEVLAPFKGGVLVPDPDLLLGGFVTGGSGALTLSANWPSGLPAGLKLWLQFWIIDPLAPAGLAASGGVQATSQ